MFVLDCCDCEVMSWVVMMVGYSGDIVCDVMLVVVENWFGNELYILFEIEWLSDNGLGYMVDDMCWFVVVIGLKLLIMLVCSL